MLDYTYTASITSFNKCLWVMEKNGKQIAVRQPGPDDIKIIEDAVNKCGEHTRTHYIGPGWWTGYKNICNRDRWVFNDKTALPLIATYNGDVIGFMHIRFKRASDMPQTYCKKLGDLWVATSGIGIIDPLQSKGFGSLLSEIREYIAIELGAEWIVGDTYKESHMVGHQKKVGWELYREWTLKDGTVRQCHGKDLRGVFDYNIISGLSNSNANPITFKNFNQVVAYSIGNALKKLGLRVNYANVSDPNKWEKLPMAKNTLVIAAASVTRIRDDPNYLKQIRKKTINKVCMYLDSDYYGYEKYFDRIFTVVKPRKIHGKHNDKYVYAGWGADKDMFKPKKTDTRTMFIDAYRTKWDEPKYKWIFDILDEVMSETDMKIHHPAHHHYTTARILWSEMAEMFNESNFFLCTQGPAESGLPRIESATAGCLLVVPGPLYMKRTMGPLEHRIWNTKEELLDILNDIPDPKKCRRKALKQTWDKTAKRIHEELT